MTAVTTDNKIQIKSAFQLKGGLYHFMTLRLLTADLSMLEEQLVEQILQAPNFFRNASVVIDLHQINHLRQMNKNNQNGYPAHPADVNHQATQDIPKTDDFSGERQTSESPGVRTKCMTGVSESSQQPRKFICEGYTQADQSDPTNQVNPTDLANGTALSNAATTSTTAPNHPMDLAAIASLLRRKGLYPIGVIHANEEQRAQASKAGLAPLHNGARQSNSTYQGNGMYQGDAYLTNSSGVYQGNNHRVYQTNNPGTHPGAYQSHNSAWSQTPIAANPGQNASGQNTSGENADSTHCSKLITSPVRSGQQIYAPEGDLIITSSVSNGAEILAEGNIHIYGTLRGRALAGINGNQDARIFCQSLEAELISIAGQFKISEDFAREHWKTAVEISLKEGRLQIRAL